MSKQLIYLTNNSSTTVAPNNAIGLGDTSRRVGNFITSSNSVYINSAGYYDVDFSATFTGTAGNVKVDIMSSGTPIASATETVETATTEYHSINIPAILRIYCCAGATISVVVDSTSTSTPTFTATGLRIVKL